MKYIRMIAHDYVRDKVRGRMFRWQWRVTYEYKHWSQSQEYYKWLEQEHHCDTRRGMRGVMRAIKHNNSYRNIKTSRRLVQVNWEDYVDSFTYNAKGNGNGR